MKLTPKELDYLELYKGIHGAGKNLFPNAKEDSLWFYTIGLNYKAVNSFLTFVFDKTPALISDINVRDLDYIMDMIFTLSDVACRYALENPEIDYRKLYRMEHKNNLNNYGEGGMTLSFKSTSKSSGEVEVFNTENSVGLAFDIDGYVPYIDVDNIVRSSVFSDEREILFPPCVVGMLNGQEEVAGYDRHFAGVTLCDNFEDGEYLDTESYKASYEIAKPYFKAEIEKANETGEISPELSTYCTVVSSYIYSRLREMYNKYANVYKENHGFSR